MLEIIRRQEGQDHIKEQVQGRSVQVSYNDWGHICIRVIHTELQEGAKEADTLIVFERDTSRRIIDFCKSIKVVRGQEDDDDIPF